MTIDRKRALAMIAGVAAVGLAVACGDSGGATPMESPTPSVIESTPAPDAPSIVSFQRTGPACDAGGQVTLTWTLGGSATGATISIDGPGVYDSYSGTSATEQFPGACNGDTQTFLLTTTGGSPAATSTIVVNPEPVQTSSAPTVPVIISFQKVGPSCDANNQVTLKWQLGGTATGASISIDGPGIYDTYSGLSVTEKFPGACNGDTQTFLLTTVGGSPAATRTLTVTP